MEKERLFVSLPMRDRDLEDIHADMVTITNFISFQLDEEYELINTLIDDEPPVDIDDPGVWYLGRSISMLSEADLVAFDSSWREARGCIIEHMVCSLYNIPYVDISMNYHEDEDFINDQTYDINEAARLNEVLSEEYEQTSGQTEDFEDALGFEPMMEHGANTDILEESEDDKPEEVEEESPELSRRQKIVDILHRRRNRIKRLSEEVEDNPYAKHADIDIVTVDELGDYPDIDKLEPGEYDADAQ